MKMYCNLMRNENSFGIEVAGVVSELWEVTKELKEQQKEKKKKKV